LLLFFVVFVFGFWVFYMLIMSDLIVIYWCSFGFLLMGGEVSLEINDKFTELCIEKFLRLDG